jgi:hypothetical protein
MVYCGAKVVRTSWRIFLLLMDGYFLVNYGLILLFCGIGKEISTFCWCFLLVSLIFLS